MTLFYRSHKTLLAAAVLLTAGWSATGHAAVMGITDLTTVPALPGSGTVNDTGRIIDSITVDGVTYTQLTSVDTVTFTGDRERMWGTDGTDPGSDAAAIVGLDYATGVLNVGVGTEFRFGRTLASDERVFILRDDPAGTDETITLQAIDLSNQIIGTLTVDIFGENPNANAGSTGDYGPELTPEVVLERESNSSPAADLTRSRVGVSFLVSDLTGTGDLSQIAGLRVSGSDGPARWDVTAVGLAAIPEPASITLLGAGVVALLGRRRRG